MACWVDDGEEEGGGVDGLGFGVGVLDGELHLCLCAREQSALGYRMSIAFLSAIAHFHTDLSSPSQVVDLKHQQRQLMPHP